MIQLPSMRIALKHFLYKINAVDSDRCDCGEGSQTWKHGLLQCQAYEDLQRELLDRLRTVGLKNHTYYDEIVTY